MVDSQLPQTWDSRSRGVSLFNTLTCPSDAYSEAFQGQGKARGHWEPIMSAFNAAGSEVLKQRDKRVNRMRHEDGATFNPFDDPTDRFMPWVLDIIPLPLTADEWRVIEAGLTQRALLLEQILSDVYGPQNLVKNGHIPPELIFDNPNFLRPCHNIQPSGNRFLTFYAADLYRHSDGQFRVLRDYGANPEGLGYALENRIVISRVFSELYQAVQIRRLAPFFNTFRNNLIQRAALRREDPGIVLLSPGPDSPLYFEQALISRYLNFPLVEAQDLTVRNGEVFLKKLNGLEPVGAVLRHIPDNESDPFALRRETASGVAGLIQVCREKNIDMVNPVGSGFVETPALSVLLPSLCDRIMGEKQIIENHPAWWCQIDAHRNHVLENLQRLSVTQAMGGGTPDQFAENISHIISTQPHRVMAKDPVSPGTVPVWDKNGVSNRYTILRIFACATQQGFAVMPGGLAMTALDVETLINQHPERQQSKDIWVVSEQAGGALQPYGSTSAGGRVQAQQ